MAEHQLFVLLPFLVFFIALIKGLPTTFLSGVLYGYWLFFFYKLYETFKSDVPKPVVQSFSTARHTELMANIPIFVGLGVLFFLLSERNPVSLKVNWLETIDYALFILTGVFLYNWFQLGFQYQYLLIDLVYGVLTFTSYRAKITGKKFFAAASYAVLSVIVIDDVKAAGLIEQTTIGLIVPLLVFIVGLLVRIPTSYKTTIVITYWFYSFYFSANLEGSLLTKLFMQSVRPEILAQTRASFGSIVIIGIILGIILQIVMKKKQKKENKF